MGRRWRRPACRRHGRRRPARHGGHRWSGDWRRAGRKASGGDASAQSGAGMTQRADGGGPEGSGDAEGGNGVSKSVQNSSK
jgi:hypothetical protein